MGKVNSKSFKQALKAKGITNGWFAVFDNIIVAGASDKAKAAACAAELVPPELRDGIVWLKP